MGSVDGGHGVDRQKTVHVTSSDEEKKPVPKDIVSHLQPKTSATYPHLLDRLLLPDECENELLPQLLLLESALEVLELTGVPDDDEYSDSSLLLLLLPPELLDSGQLKPLLLNDEDEKDEDPKLSSSSSLQHSARHSSTPRHGVLDPCSFLNLWPEAQPGIGNIANMAQVVGGCRENHGEFSKTGTRSE